MNVDIDRPAGGVPADVVITTTGPATVRELLELRAALARLDGVGPGTRVLVDHTPLDLAGVTTEDARTLGESLRALPEAGSTGARVAILAENPAVYGAVRQMLTFAQIDADRMGLEPVDRRIAAFSTQAGAVAWLAAPATGAG